MEAHTRARAVVNTLRNALATMPEVSKEALNELRAKASALKLRMRVWERRFEKEHDRKAERADKKVDKQ